MQIVNLPSYDKYAGLRSMLGGALQGFENTYQRNMANQDMQKMLSYLQNPYIQQIQQNPSMITPTMPMISPAGGFGVMGGAPQITPQAPTMNQIPREMPKMNSPIGQQLAAMMVQNQMMSPLQQAQAEYYKNRQPAGSNISARVIKGSNGKYYQFNPDTQKYEQTDIGIGSASGNILTKNLIGDDGRLHTFQIDKITGDRTDLGLAKELEQAPGNWYESRFIQPIQTHNTITDLISMAETPEGKKNTGLFDTAVQKFKQGIGASNPQEEIFKEKYTQLQKLLRQLNGEARMSDQDYTRLKDSLPSRILNDAAFLGAIKQMKTETERNIDRDIIATEEIGWRLPNEYKNYKNNKGFNLPEETEMSTSEDYLKSIGY